MDNGLEFEQVEPWPEPVDGKVLLDGLVELLKRFVVLPKGAAETLALWIVHTYAFLLRDVSTYIGLESPEKRCGKTTLLTVLGELVNRPVIAANISSPAFFRVIEEIKPTLLIDEADTFLQGNDELKGILNSGYKRKTAYVVRVTSQGAKSKALEAEGNGNGTEDGSRLAKFSCWCPKMVSAIGPLPDTLADRCIVIRMQRKTPKEECDRVRNLEAKPLRQMCARFVKDHLSEIANAEPEIPPSLNDRAADIWEPLFAIGDLAGGDWPAKAREAASSLIATAQDSNPIGSLLLDMFVVFVTNKVDRIFSRSLVDYLNGFVDRPWLELKKGRQITEQWLARLLRPYGIKPRTIRIGEERAKGYYEADLRDAFKRYIPRAEVKALLEESREEEPEPPENPENPKSNGEG